MKMKDVDDTDIKIVERFARAIHHAGSSYPAKAADLDHEIT